MQKSERLERRDQQFPHLAGLEGTIRKNLGQALFGVFHDNEQQRASFDLALSRVE